MNLFNLVTVIIVIQVLQLIYCLPDSIKTKYIIAGHYCPLFELGKLYDNDKIVSHNYGNLYCELMQQFRHMDKKVKMYLQ
jgi:hypothetical protein